MHTFYLSGSSELDKQQHDLNAEIWINGVARCDSWHGVERNGREEKRVHQRRLLEGRSAKL